MLWHCSLGDWKVIRQARNIASAVAKIAIVGVWRTHANLEYMQSPGNWPGKQYFDTIDGEGIGL